MPPGRLPTLFLLSAVLLDAVLLIRVVRLDQPLTGTLPNLAGVVVMLAAAVVGGRQARRSHGGPRRGT